MYTRTCRFGDAHWRARTYVRIHERNEFCLSLQDLAVSWIKRQLHVLIARRNHGSTLLLRASRWSISAKHRNSLGNRAPRWIAAQSDVEVALYLLVQLLCLARLALGPE